MRAILALTLVGAVTALTSVAAMAQTPKQTPSQAPAATPPDTIDSVRTPNNERSLTEFWTPERLRNAQPMPMPRVDPNDVKDQNKDQSEEKK
jgi:hypothetical protein